MGIPEALVHGLFEGALSVWPLYPLFGALMLAAGGLRIRERRPRRRAPRQAGLVVDLTPVDVRRARDNPTTGAGIATPFFPLRTVAVRR